MHHELTLDELLVIDDIIYIGDCATVVFKIEEIEYRLPILKGPLIEQPRYFESVYLERLTRTPCAYSIMNRKTKQRYFGGTINVYDRLINHRYHIKHNVQYNPNFRKLSRSVVEDWDFIAIFTETKNEAHVIEQHLITKYWGNPLLINIAKSATLPMFDPSPEVRAKMSARASMPERIVQAKAALEATRENPELVAKTKANQIEAVGIKVMAYGILHLSVAAALRELNISKELFYILINNAIFKEVYLVDTNSNIPRSNTVVMSEEMKHLWKLDQIEMHRIAGSKMRVIINNTEYESLAVAAIGENISKTVIRKWVLETEPDENGIRHLKIPENFKPRGKYNPRKHTPIVETASS